MKESMNELVNEMNMYKIHICALQEIRWPEKGTEIKKRVIRFYIVDIKVTKKSGRGIYINKHIMDSLLDFEPENERISKIRVKLNYYNLTLIPKHAPTEKKDEVAKEELCSSLEKVCEAVPNYNMKRVLRDFNTEVGKESYLYSAHGGHRLYNETNDNGKQVVNFALGGGGINIMPLTRSSGNNLTTKYVT